jgi:2-polyprenyl-3-methyl-5-hydroxy-6-metoxy-1,4-benzoquinol methylase
LALPESCPLCGAKASAQSVVTAHVYGARGQGHAFFHCANCDVRYQYPGLTPEEEVRFYAQEFESFMAVRAGAGAGWSSVDEHARANEPTRLRRAKYLEPYLLQPRSILEVGCSSGFMIRPLTAAGHECVGVEPSGVFSEQLRQSGMLVAQSLEQLHALAPGRRFDLIMHFFVLEHIAQPRAFLESQLSLLKSNGKIIFEIPNAADPIYSIYDIPAFERFYWSMAHPWYFSEQSLHYLLTQLGRRFEVRREQRYDLSNHLVWARDGRPGGMGRFSQTLGGELEEAYRQRLIAIGKCDTLIGIVSAD